MAVRAMAFNNAKSGDFLDALAVTNSAVVLIDHGWSYRETPFSAIGFCFAGDILCLAPEALLQVTTDTGQPATLTTGPAIGSLTYGLKPLNSGFQPKAKVVILAMCGATRTFTDQWHLSNNQALIVPAYAPNSNNLINLWPAALDVQFLLDQLTSWNNVGQAVDALNNNNGATGAGYQWTVIPEGGRNVTFNLSSH
jgi:hypothetical protein